MSPHDDAVPDEASAPEVAFLDEELPTGGCPTGEHTNCTGHAPTPGDSAGEPTAAGEPGGAVDAAGAADGSGDGDVDHGDGGEDEDGGESAADWYERRGAERAEERARAEAARSHPDRAGVTRSRNRLVRQWDLGQGDPEDRIVRPVMSLQSLKVMREMSPGRRAAVLGIIFAAGALMWFTFTFGASPAAKVWSSRGNLISTVEEVNKLTAVRLPLSAATAEHLTEVHVQRAAARRAGAPQSGRHYNERVRYVDATTESAKGSVSVFADNQLWAAASREHDGVCVWALISQSGWHSTYTAGVTSTCTAADAVVGSQKVVDAYRAGQATAKKPKG